MTKMTEQLIEKYNLRLCVRDGKEGFLGSKKFSDEDMKVFQENKETIRSILKHREQQEAEKKITLERLKLEEIEKIKNGAVPITPAHNDEYGWFEVFLPASKMLREIGFAHEAGYHTIVPAEAIRQLGTSFTFAQAVEYMKPLNEAKEQKEAEKTKAVEAKYAEARNTGKPVMLETRSAPCDDENEECSIDRISIYAMADGTKRIKRTHTF